MTCQHEDVALVCPMGCGETVDSDTYVCSVCKEGVAPDAYCNLCEEVIMEAVPHGMSMKQVCAQIEDERQATVLKAQLEASLERQRFAYHDPSEPCPDCGGTGCRCTCGAA